MTPSSSPFFSGKAAAGFFFRLASLSFFIGLFVEFHPLLAAVPPSPGSISVPRAVARGELNEYPDVAVDETGVAHVVWIQLQGDREHVMYRSFIGARAGQVLDVGGPWERQYWPRILAVGKRVWVTWCARERGVGEGEAQWKIYIREISGGRLHGLIALSDGRFPALRPAIGVDAGGAPWVAWEVMEGERFQVVARRLGSEGVPGPLLVAGDDVELNLRPALSPRREGGIWVVWDAYAYGEYRILARPLDREGAGDLIQISDEAAVNVGAFAHTLPNGDVVIAYATNSGDSGDQRVGKELRVRVLSEGIVRHLAGGDPPRVNTAPDRRDAIEFPSVVSDAAGRLWLFARRGQGSIAFCYEGDRWYRPRDLSEPGWGGRGREVRAARAGRVFHLVTRRLHLLSHQLFTPAKGPVHPLELAPVDPLLVSVDETSLPSNGLARSSSVASGFPETHVEEPPSTLTASLVFPFEEASEVGDLDGAKEPFGGDLDHFAGKLFETSEADAARTFPLTSKQAPSPRVASARGGNGWAPPALPSSSRRWRGVGAVDRSPLEGVVIPDGVGAPRPTLSSAARFNVLEPEDGPMPVERPAGLYFGDLHTHSWMSDGAGDPDEVYTRSRDRYRYDFVALTDHDYENGNILLPSEWAYLKLIADFFNRPGEFVTFQAYEWTAPAYPRGPGHRNVYFSGDDAPLFSAAGVGKGTKTLFELLKQYQAIAVPHHIGWTGTDWENHDGDVQRAVEVVSVHGAFEKPGNLPVLPRHELAGMFVRDGLLRQYRFGFVGGSDGHGFPWHYGVSRKEDVWRTGLTGVRAPALSRATLHAAIYNRSTYATSGAPIVLSFSADGFPMGSELELNRGPRFDIRVEGSATLEEIVLVRDTEDIRHFKPYGEDFTASVYDNPTAGNHFYYIRAVQEDGELALSSPIWIELKGKVRVGPPDP